MNPLELPGGSVAADAPAMWDAIARRDRSADGRFVYAVRSTGVYCRPSCGARLPKPENVLFYDNGAAAARAGFRACKRCKPNEGTREMPHAPAIERVCRLIEAADDSPRLEQLASVAGLSPHYFHRVFKAITGVTPRAYADRQRVRRMQTHLAEASSVTNAIYDAGYNANSRFYEKSHGVLGMTATQYRNGGAHARIRFALAQCSLGAILVAVTGQGICALLLGDDPEALLRDLQDRFPRAELVGGERDFDQFVARVIAMVENPGLAHDLPLDIRGTAFQQRVWEALRAIPPGTTATYAEIAARLGAPKSARAVAAACAANPIAVAVPCHRVVRRDGDLAGYRWGLERKQKLLKRETGED